MTRWLGPLLFPLILVTVGCSSSPRELPPPLPFRVALLPARILDDAVGGEKSEFQVELGEDWFNRALADELNRVAFVDVIPLSPARTDDPLVADRQYIEGARGTDLIIRPIIRYDSRIKGGSNERQLDSYHLFFTGPFLSWYLEDWDFSFNGQPVRMTARTYFTDTAEPPLRFSNRLDQKLLEDDPQVEADDPALSFVERTGDNWEQYALALILPSNLLAGDVKSAADDIREEVVRSLAERLTLKLSREPRIFSNPEKANVRLLRREPEFAPRPDGQISLRLPVGVCFPDRPGLHSYRVEGGLRTMIPRDHRNEYELQGTIPAIATRVRVEIWDAQDSKRSFTFAVNLDSE